MCVFVVTHDRPECQSMQAWCSAEGDGREREGQPGELECISGLK